MASLWSGDDVTSETDRRVAALLAATEIHVDYYRIGYRLAFQLPVSARPEPFPSGVLGSDRAYPWLIWLGWRLEERWRLLAYVSRVATTGAPVPVDQARIEALLADELDALAQWRSFDADYGGAGLVTASLSAACADILEHPDAHDVKVLGAAENVAGRICGESIADWYAATWAGVDPVSLAYQEMHNIKCITLFRGAQLATAINHRLADSLQAKAAEVYATWLAARADPEPMTEGAAYDGFMLDSMTDWIAARPDADTLRRSGQAVLSRLPEDWARLSLPGRPDLLAPVGDVEPEMTQWAAVALRLCRWYGTNAAGWLRTVPLPRLPGWALADAAVVGQRPDDTTVPEPGVHLQPSAVTMRPGWEPDDPVVVVAASRTPVGHLHTDAGHVVIGWHGRWWITDPGYQQYRLGDERDFTIGANAHNPPVIDGTAQTVRAAAIALESGDQPRAVVDLTECYEGTPEMTVSREVRLLPDGVLVWDRVTDSERGSDLATSWHADRELAWAFVDGAARLSDGDRALWLTTGTGTNPEPLDPTQLHRHDGTRGPLRLDHRAPCDAANTVRWWLFLFDPAGGWQPPMTRVRNILLNTTSTTSPRVVARS